MKPAKDYIIFPLDVSSVEAAKHYVGLLTGYVGMFKIGLELFVRSGPETVKLIQASGSAGIFLDLKLHDIPATVSRAMNVIADLGAAFVTVHCGESKQMLEAAVSGSRKRVGILGVTVLTSVSAEDIQAAGFKDKFSKNLSELVIKRAAIAKAAGCAGIICSGLEAGMIKEKFGKDFLAVTPGIRPLWNAAGKDDQKRITTPTQAVQNGSDYLVIGRPIRDAKDPAAAAIRIAEEIDCVK